MLDAPKPIEIALDPKRAKALIGAEISTDTMTAMLEHLGIRQVSTKGEKQIFSIPSFRVDMSEEADLIEEIARIYGYQNIPSTHLADPLPPGAVLAREPGGFVVRLERPIDQLWLRVTPEAHNRLMAGRDLALAELGHRALEIRPAPCPE